MSTTDGTVLLLGVHKRQLFVVSGSALTYHLTIRMMTDGPYVDLVQLAKEEKI